MLVKILAFLGITFSLMASQEQDSCTFDQQLMYENLIFFDPGKFPDWTIYNVDEIASYTLMINLADPTMIDYLVPFKAFKKGVAVQSLSADHFLQLSSLPFFPKEIKNEDAIILNVFAFVSEAFGRNDTPLYFYATRALKENETLSDFDTYTNFTEALMQYSRVCSLIPTYPDPEYCKWDDPSKFKYIKQLADIGIVDAQFKCGVMFYNGTEIKKNCQEARRYFKLAADHGCKNAKNKYDEMQIEPSRKIRDSYDILSYIRDR